MQSIIREMLSFGVPEYSSFMVYLSKYNKSYADLASFESRLKVYTLRNKELRLLNQQLTTSTVGVNEYTDWTTEELQQQFNPFGVIEQSPDPMTLGDTDVYTPSSSLGSVTTPNGNMYVDWEACGCTSPVQNMNVSGQCSSSYAFAAVGALEGAYQIALWGVTVPWTPSQTSLPAQCNTPGAPLVAGSVQQVVSCSTPQNNICAYGYVQYSLNYSNGFSLVSNTTAPYVGNTS